MGLSEIEFLLKGLAYLLPLFMPSAVKQKRNCYFKGDPKPSCKGYGGMLDADCVKLTQRVDISI